MPICEICGMEVVTVYECSECGAKFCDECGNIKHRLCYDCLGWEAEGGDEKDDDQGVWDEEYHN